MQQSSVKPVALNHLLRRTKIAEIEKSSRNASGTFRPIMMRTGALHDQKGSVYVEFGSTKIICSVDGPKELTKTTDVEPTEGQLYVYFKNTSMESNSVTGSNFSSTSNKENNGIRSAVESALRSIVCLELFCKAQIDVEITVLSDDGGVLAASLMASSLALIDSGIQVYDVCVAAHILMLPDGRIIVDPSTSLFPLPPVTDSEEFPENAYLSVTVGMMPSLNQLACCEFVGIAAPNQLRQAISVAVENSLKLYPLVRKTLTVMEQWEDLFTSSSSVGAIKETDIIMILFKQTTGSTRKKSSVAASCAEGASPRSARYGYRRFRNEKKRPKLLGSSPAPAAVESENVVTEQNSVSQSSSLGSNAKGEDERYPIKEQSSGISVLPLKPSKRKVCKYFATEKSCYFGKYCRFLHIKNETDANISGSVPSHTSFKPVRSIIRPNVAVVTKDDVGKNEQLDIRNSEINYFGRRFRDAKFTYNDNSCFIEFEYKVTDPEWVFEVKAVRLRLEIPEQYPCKSFMVFLSETSLPTPFIAYFNKEIKKFLEGKFLKAEKCNSYIGLGKTFIRWLDHNIFDLFVEGLRRTKMIVEAENEGIKLHQTSFSTCTIQEEDSAPETHELKLTPKLDEGSSNKADMKEEHNYSKTEVEHLSKQEISSSQPPKSKVLEVRVFWNDLNGNIATLTVVTLGVSIRCAKCSALSFLTCSAKQLSASYCLKCSNGYSIHIFPQHIHQNSNVIALLEAKGCLPLDCVLLSSKLAYVCMQCNKDATVENVIYGAVNKIWCYRCHSKCDFEIRSIRFVGDFNSIAKEDSSLPKDKMS
uniref:C3H1-type domain-containing protein n=1 Tax=Setaria digitata TaxID=48799 RepID=A0A915PEZ5_9BILA